MQPPLEEAFGPESFRQLGHQVIDLLADYLADVQSDTPPPVLPWITPDEQFAHWEKKERTAPLAFLKEVLSQSNHLHHPQYMGHQVSPTLPLSALAGLVSEFLNNGMAIYEMGPVGTVLERLVIQTANRTLGFGEQSGGFLTSGGTLANLTALLAARRAIATHNVWEEGQTQPLALLVSEQAHYCIDRAARIMGWGSEGIIKVPSDEHFRMRTELLPQLLQEASQEGRQVIAVVGSACTTSTGSYDPLPAIADFCAANNLWMHVDGAHGAGVIFSKKYCHLVDGIERADSVSMDFHKMMMSPALITALLFRDQRWAHANFQQQAAYLFEEGQDLDWYNLGKQSFECTKLMMSLKIMIQLQAHGTDLWEAYIDQVHDNTQVFAREVTNRPNWEMATHPQSNILCFRHTAPGTGLSLNALNTYLRKATLEDGRFYIVQTVLNGQVFLRCTFTNAQTGSQHFQRLLDQLEIWAEEFISYSGTIA
jgi:L-2,4-diaminobutyrate decarboxylase